MNDELGREFCRRVTDQLRHVTSGEKAAIEDELRGHMEDRIEALTALNWPEDEAEQRAVAAMGDPEEVGRRLAKEYPLSWLVVGRAALVLIVLVCCVLIMNRSWVNRVDDHITGRFFRRLSAQRKNCPATAVKLSGKRTSGWRSATMCCGYTGWG